MASSIRIDIGCDVCGGKHEIYIQSNRMGNAKSYQFDCPHQHKPVTMPATAYFSLEAVPAIPAQGVIATIIE